MRKTEFIQKYLGSPKYPFCDANREAMYDDLHLVVEYSNRFEREFEEMKKEYNVETVELDGAKQSPVIANGGPLDGLRIINERQPCCPYEDRASGGRCNNCGDPPKGVALPKDYVGNVSLKYLNIKISGNNSDFSL
jgi:hypothetical protein